MNDHTTKSGSVGPTTSRRGFLGLCASAGVGTTLGMRSFRAIADVVPHKQETWTDSDQVIPSTCNMCVNRCGIRCHVVNGILEKIDGDPRNPKSRGGTCAKGQAGVMTLYDPDRIKYPLIRVGKRGEGKWRRASWEEAHEYVAENLNKIITKHGTKSLLWSSTTDLTEKFFVKFGKYLGTPNFARHASLCLSSRNVGYFATLGGVPDSDLVNAKYILMYGANRLESFELPYNIDLIEALKRGTKLAVVDPRFTYTASKGEWIAIRPRSDLALNLALMHVLIKENLYDSEFVTTATTGFDELKAHVAEYTPEWAEKETSVAAAKIVSMAREMAAAAPAVVIFPGRRTSWYTNDSQFRRSAAMLTALLGAFDAPGACFFNKGKLRLGSFEWEMEPLEVPTRFDDFEKRFPLAHHGDGGYVSLRDSVVDGTAKYPVKGWMVYHQNPLAAVLDGNKTLKMIEQMDFIGVIDIQPSQTAWMADIILPETCYLERLDPVWAPGGTRKYAAIRQPVVAPQYEAKTILEILKGIAGALDKKHEFETPLADAFNFTMEQFVDAQLKTLPINREQLMKEGIWLAKEEDPELGAYRSGKKTFKTPSGKVEFVAERFRRNNYPALPTYEKSAGKAGAQRLITGHMALFTHSSNQNNPWLNEHYKENELWINPITAKAKGIATGDLVKVTSPAGEIRIKALATPKIREDTVFIVHGFGSNSSGQTTVKGRGGAGQTLMQSQADEVSNNQAMHETFVDVVKA